MYGFAMLAVAIVVLSLLRILGCAHSSFAEDTSSTSNSGELSAVSDLTAPSQSRIPVSSDVYLSQIQGIHQYSIGLSAGCEIVSLSIILNCMGVDIEANTIVDTYLEYGNDYHTAYKGDPYTSGGTFPPAVVTAGNAVLEDCAREECVYDLTGFSFDELLSVIDDGYPVGVWTTLYFTAPDFEQDIFGNYSDWYYIEHCVVMYGYDSDLGLVYLCDPAQDSVTLDLEYFRSLYYDCGSMALAIW